MKMVFKVAALAVLLSACADDGETTEPPSTITNASDVPLDGLSATDVAEFHRGDDLFDLRSAWSTVSVPTSSARRAARVTRRAREARGSCRRWRWSRTTASPHRRPVRAAVRPLDPPGPVRRGDDAGRAAQLPNVLVTIRLGPPVLGRGYMEAISDAEISIAAEEATRSDAIHGKIPMTTFTSVPSGDGFSSYQMGDDAIGRFASRPVSRRSTTSPPMCSRATWA